MLAHSTHAPSLLTHALQAASLYGLTLIRPSKPLPPRGTGVIIALEPHDILPYSLFAFAWHLNLCPDLPEGYGLMTSTVFQLPYVRQIYNYCCGDSIDKKTFTKHLKNDKTCVIIPGGVQEVIEMQTELRKDPDTKKLFLYLNERKGFVKLALMHGSTIIPSFTFGYDGSYFTWIPDPEGEAAICASRSFVRFPSHTPFSLPSDKWNLNKKFGFLPMLYFGRLCGFSSNVLPLGIPNPPQPLTIVMGDPIAVPKTVSPSQGDIDKYHLDFITGMKKVFEDHKVEHGYKDRELVII